MHTALSLLVVSLVTTYTMSLELEENLQEGTPAFEDAYQQYLDRGG